VSETACVVWECHEKGMRVYEGFGWGRGSTGRPLVRGKEDGATHARLLHCVLYRFVGDEVSFLALFSGFGLFLHNVRNESMDHDGRVLFDGQKVPL